MVKTHKELTKVFVIDRICDEIRARRLGQGKDEDRTLLKSVFNDRN